MQAASGSRPFLCSERGRVCLPNTAEPWDFELGALVECFAKDIVAVRVGRLACPIQLHGVCNAHYARINFANSGNRSHVEQPGLIQCSQASLIDITVHARISSRK